MDAFNSFTESFIDKSTFQTCLYEPSTGQDLNLIDFDYSENETLSHRPVFCDNAEARQMLNSENDFDLQSEILHPILHCSQRILEQSDALMCQSDHVTCNVMWEEHPYALAPRSQCLVTDVTAFTTEQDHRSSRPTILLHEQLANLESSLCNVEKLVKSTLHADDSSTFAMEVHALAQVQLEHVQTPSVLGTIQDDNRPSHAALGSTALFLPPPFLGDLQQDARDYVRIFKLWAQYQALDESNALAAFQLLMKNNAANWIKTIDKDKIQNLDHLLDLFLKRFTSHEKIYENISQMWLLKQDESQTAESFIEQILVRAKPLNLNEKNIFDIVRNGLKPATRCHVIQADVKNLEELKEQAIRFERAEEPKQNTAASEVLKTITEFQNQLKDLQSRAIAPVGNSDVAFLEAVKRIPQEIESLPNRIVRPRSNDNRVNAQNAFDPYSDVTKDTVLQEAQGPQTKVWSQRKRKFKNKKRFTSSKQVSKVNSKAFAPKFNRPTEHCQNFNLENQHFETDKLLSRCNRCARIHDAHFCPAKGAICKRCNKLDHFARACRNCKFVYNNGDKLVTQVRWNKRKCHPLRNDSDRVIPSHQRYCTQSHNDSQKTVKGTGNRTADATLSMHHAGAISVFVYGKQKFAQLDSGSEISAVSVEFLKELPSHRKLDTSVSANLCSANKEKLKVLGQVEIPLHLNGLKVNFKFLVISNLCHEILIGHNFLLFTNANINYANQTVTFYDELVTLSLRSRVDQVQDSVLQLASNVTIAPGCATLLPIEIPTEFVNTDAIIQPLEASPNQKFQVARILVHPTTRSSVVHVLNTTSSELVISRDRPIASITAADPATVPPITSTSPSQPVDTSPLDSVTRDAMLKDLGIQIDHSHLSKDQVEQLSILLCRNRKVFAKDLSEIPGTDLVTHSIPTFGLPTRQRAFRHSPEARAEISRQTREMLEQQIISESFSLWASPVLLVSKKADQSPRFVVDLRALNKQTIGIAYPLPSLETVLDVMSDNHPSYFSALDLRSGYFQIKMHPDSREKTTFITHEGTYCFNRMCFGLCNAMQSFQHLMQTVFKGELFKFTLVYVDDVLVYSKSFEEHMEHLQVVFTRLLDAKLRLHPSKCKFAREEVSFLGHRLSSQGVSVDQSKVERVKSFPRPQNVTQLRQFLGLCNYYRRFVKGYSQIAVSLNELLRKDTKFLWTDACQTAFEDLKDALAKTPILAYADMNKPFTLTTDASNKAIAYILSQADSNGRQVPLSFGSRALRQPERNYMICETECLAVLEGIRQFHPYLVGRHFEVITDNLSLQWLQQIRASHGRLARWSLLLQGYNFTIKYRAGKENSAADALSRVDLPDPGPVSPNDEFLNDNIYMTPINHCDNSGSVEVFFEYHEPMQTIAPVVQNDNSDDAVDSDSQFCDFSVFDGIDLASSQRRCSELKPLIDYLESDILPEDNVEARKLILHSDQYNLRDDILFHHYQPRSKNIAKVKPLISQLVVPSSLRQQVLHACHEELAHPGHERCYVFMRQRFFWRNMYNDSLNYIASCTTCQQSKRPIHPTKASLHPLPIEEVFGRWSMDFACDLPVTAAGNKHILLLVETTTKWPEMVALPNQRAETVAQVLYDNIFTRYGPPTSILSDRGQNFMSTLVSEVCRRFNVKRTLTSSYHAQTNSQAERYFSSLWQSLRAHGLKQKEWDTALSTILYAHRATPSTSSTHFSPAFLMYGREIKLPMEQALVPAKTGKVTADSYIKELLPKLEMAREIAKANVQEAQKRYKTQYDKNQRPAIYEPGTYVWLHNPHTAKGDSPKLRRKYEGPYYVVQRSDKDTYILRDAKTNKKHPSPVHVNRLRLHVDDRDILFSKFEDLGLRNNEPSTDATDVIDSTEDTNLQPAPVIPDAQDDTVRDDPCPDTVDDGQDNGPDARQSTTSNTQNTGPDWHAVTRLMASKFIKGQRYFKVLWEDRTYPPSWQHEDDVSDALKHAFYITHTKAGKRRKRKL